MTIQQHYGRRDTVGYASKHGEVMDCPLPDWLVGIELEIENFSLDFTQRWGGVTFTQDGSLRNSDNAIGIEAITKPIAIKYVGPFLSAFYKHFKITEENYNERCSTHVHFNVEPLTFEQVATIGLVYQTVESLLFHYVGNDRQYNVFCVPWNQSNISYNIVNKIKRDNGHEVFRRWQKYSACNLIPIVEQGTIEFRHLHGTCDVSLITNWIYLIAKIFEYAQKVTLEEAQHSIINMNTVSNYHEWMTTIFGKYFPLLQVPRFEDELARGVVESKLMLMTPMLPAAAPPLMPPPPDGRVEDVLTYLQNYRELTTAMGARSTTVNRTYTVASTATGTNIIAGARAQPITLAERNQEVQF